MPLVFPFENIFSQFNPMSNSSGGFKNNSMNNSDFNQLINQNEKFISNKNSKKSKKSKKNNNKKYKDKRPFDWICNRCSNLNYSFRNFCNICNLPRNENQFYNSNMSNNNS